MEKLYAELDLVRLNTQFYTNKDAPHTGPKERLRQWAPEGPASDNHPEYVKELFKRSFHASFVMEGPKREPAYDSEENHKEKELAFRN